MTTTVEATATTATPPSWQRYLYTPAVLDWLSAAYLATVLAGLGMADRSLPRDRYLTRITMLLILYAAAIFLLRTRFDDGNGEARAPAAAPLEPRRRAALIAYRLLPFPVMLGVFFWLRGMLPIINGSNLDALLFQLDVRLFGVEPTIAVERFTSPRVIEWFAFFYYSYFYFIATFIFIMLATCRDERRLAWFATGVIGVVTVGHFVYMLVPGLGPYAHLAHDYQGPLRGGPFLHLVLETVSAGGAMRDIFPSLHTALPTFCTLFAWRHYRRYAPFATLWAANIVGATIVLRWHWMIDVVAGVTLATTAFLVAPALVEGYQRRRERLGLGWMRRW